MVDRALALGITHFDTARLYSDGLSERALGDLLAPRRAAVTISTKFGLLPTPLVGSMGKAAKPIRKVRTLADRLRLVPYPLRSYSAATMRKSLKASLRALKTDYIDIYEVHEPQADTVLSDELVTELERAKAAGTIRSIGVSGNEIDAVVQRYRGVFDVIQAAESSWDAALWVPDITHSLFSDTANRSSSTLPPGSIRKMLHEALVRRPEGAVIVQTRSPERLTQLVEFAQQQAR
ncbi:aldo/keto reductase [Mycolicibacterium baixiangningiae]|uniref:aldo/keto reductase n=1 Tax=Mycolicibacterium baixiangningiae TaxID=2761578 RepID=UPI001E5BA842|nr:aldo/keto reductase [Mycolicibacterium baixiangningiae]